MMTSESRRPEGFTLTKRSGLEMKPQASLPTVAIGLGGLQFGGCQINALDLSRTLMAKGFRVVVFAIDDKPLVSVLPYAQRSGLDVVVLPASSNLFRQAGIVAAFCRSHQVDIVHGFAPWLGQILSLACGMNPRAVAVVTNWTMANERGIPTDLPLLLGTADLVREARPSRRGSVYLLEPPVDMEHDDPQRYDGSDFRRMFDIPSQSTLIVTVTRLDSEMKAESVLSLIRAVEVVGVNRDVALAIVGDGDVMQHVRTVAELSNTQATLRRVVICGSLVDPGVAYASADIVVGMGGSAIRGLAFGKATIVVGENGFARTFNSDTSGFFLQSGFYGIGPESEFGSTRHLLDALNMLLDPDVREREGAIGAAIVRDRFSLVAATQTLMQVYRDAVSQRCGGLRQVAYGAWTAARWMASRLRHIRTLERMFSVRLGIGVSE